MEARAAVRARTLQPARRLRAVTRRHLASAWTCMGSAGSRAGAQDRGPHHPLTLLLGVRNRPHQSLTGLHFWHLSHVCLF